LTILRRLTKMALLTSLRRWRAEIVRTLCSCNEGGKNENS
jgi:hypothetical protein